MSLMWLWEDCMGPTKLLGRYYEALRGPYGGPMGSGGTLWGSTGLWEHLWEHLWVPWEDQWVPMGPWEHLWGPGRTNRGPLEPWEDQWVPWEDQWVPWEDQRVPCVSHPPHRCCRG